MLEDTLFQYGALGVLCSVLIYLMQRQFKQRDLLYNQMELVVNNNTIALTKFYEIAKKCKKV